MDITKIKNKYEEIMQYWKDDKKVEKLKNEMNILLQKAFDKYGENNVIKEYQKFVRDRWNNYK